MIANGRKHVFTTRKYGMRDEICSHSVASFEQFEQPLNSTIEFIQKKRSKNPNDSEDDGEGIRRMKDLQDLGLGVAFTGKPNMQANMKEACLEDLSRLSLQSERDFCDNLSSISLKSSFKRSCSSSRTTKLFCVYQNLKRRNRRRRRLTKIWVESDKVNVPLIYQDSIVIGDLPSFEITVKRFHDLKSSPDTTKFSLTDKCSLNRSESSCERTQKYVRGTNGTAAYDFNPSSVVLDNADADLSNGLVSVPILIGERNAEGVISISNSCTSDKIHSYAAEKLSKHSVQVCLVSKSEIVEASSSSSVSPANHIIQRMKKSKISLISKIKGHSRYSSFNNGPNSDNAGDEVDNSSDSSGHSIRCTYLTEKSNMNGAQIVPASINSATTKDFSYIYYSLMADNNLQSSCSTSGARLKRDFRKLFMSTMQVHDSDKHEPSVVSISPRCALQEPSMNARVASLYDVELKVKTNYHGQRAPLVSVVSKLNGKAIVGHAITVDILGDGSSTTLVNGVSQLTSSVNLLRNRKSPSLKRKPLGGRNISSAHSSVLKRKRYGARKSGFSPRKIRRLSSITVDLSKRKNDREIIVELLEPPYVSCIPLEVVFSRLNEALSCFSAPTN